MDNNHIKKLLFVGAFPPKNRTIRGGNVTDCRILLESTLPSLVNLILIDSTQISNPPPNFLVRLLLAKKRFIKYIWYLLKHKPDAVLLFSGSGSGLIEKGCMAWISHILRIPVMFFPRGGGLLKDFNKSLLMRLKAKFAFMGAKKILCQGEKWQKLITNNLRKNISDAPIIRNWTATDSLLEIGTQRSHKRNHIEIRFLFLGWLEQEKGVMDLILAFKGVFKDFTNIHLTFVGDGTLSTTAKDEVDKLGIKERVIFRGWLDGESLLAEYSKADIFVLPSWIEGLPNALIEAMAAKLPVIVTSVGDIPSVIQHKENGILIPPRDVTAMKEAMIELITNPGLRYKIASNAFENASTNYSVDMAVNKIISLLNEISNK